MSRLALLALALVSVCAGAAEAPDREEAMRIARGFIEKGIQDWNTKGLNDPEALTEDVDIINAMGPHWHGKATAGGNGQYVIDKYRPQLRLDKLVSAEMIAPGLILVISRGVSIVPEGRPGAGEHALHQLTLLKKVGNRWLMRAVTSTPIVGTP
jgi:hypothetical protein